MFVVDEKKAKARRERYISWFIEHIREYVKAASKSDLDAGQRYGYCEQVKSLCVSMCTNIDWYLHSGAPVIIRSLYLYVDGVETFDFDPQVLDRISTFIDQLEEVLTSSNPNPKEKM